MAVVAHTRQFALMFDWQGQPAANVFHVVKPAGWDLEEDAAGAAWFRDWWDDSVKSEVSTACSLTQIKVRDLDPANQPTFIYESGLPITGTSSGTAAPTNVTACVTWRTALSGRSFRGRTYHVGLTVTKFALSKLTVPVQAEMIQMYTDLIDAVEDEECELAVVSYRTNKDLRDYPIATPITSCYVDRNLDSMRRRLPGRGPTA